MSTTAKRTDLLIFDGNLDYLLDPGSLKQIFYCCTDKQCCYKSFIHNNQKVIKYTTYESPAKSLQKKGQILTSVTLKLNFKVTSKYISCSCLSLLTHI